MLLKKLFDSESSDQSQGRTLSDALRKIESLHHERFVILQFWHTHTHTHSHMHTHTFTHTPLSHSNRPIRDDLLLEIKALQQSSSQLNEERIYDLKQRIEDLLMEQDAITSRNTNLKREASMMRCVTVM